MNQSPFGQYGYAGRTGANANPENNHGRTACC